MNDGTWHTVQLSSISGGNRTQLSVDDTYIGRTSGCKKINITSPYYIGAVPSEKLQTAKIHLEVFKDEERAISRVSETHYPSAHVMFDLGRRGLVTKLLIHSKNILFFQ